jgi:lipopolysaccharide biosynthesis glycosyltransferase
MKNFFKFNSSIKFILAIVLYLSFEIYFTKGGNEKCVVPACSEVYPDPTAVPSNNESGDEKYVFVFACDEGYAGPTAVTIRSLMDTNRYMKTILILAYKVTLESAQKLKAMADTWTTIHVIDLCDRQWKAMPNFHGESIDLIESIKKVGEGSSPGMGELDGVEFLNEQPDRELYRFMVNLRFFLPEIFASRFLPEDLWGIDYFLWLDSDLLVHNDLSKLWEIARKHLCQGMFGANLVQNLCYARIEETSIDIKRVFVMSGGVVLWNIKQIIGNCYQVQKNVFAWIIFQKNTIIQRIDPDYHGEYPLLGEEEIFTMYIYEFLRNNAQKDERVRIFPIEYNVAWRGFWTFFVDRPEDISIFHWDGMPKPWLLNNDNINEVLPFCYESYDEEALPLLRDFEGITLEILFPPTLEKQDTAFVIPKRCTEGRYFESLFETPQKGYALLKRHFPHLLEKNFPADEISEVLFREGMLFLREVLLWKEIAAETEFY